MANAFGSLSNITVSAPTSQTKATDSAITGSTVPAAEFFPRPEMMNTVKYVFTGTPLELTDKTVNVLERTVGAALKMPADLQTSAGLGRMGFGQLTDPRLENLTIRNGDESWTVSPIEGTISMYLANNAVVSVMKGLTESDMMPGVPQPLNTDVVTPPVDTAATIVTANAYLKKQGIATSAYDKPVATSTPGYGFDVKALDSISSRPVPGYSAQVQVLYPLLIGGLPVVQSSGEPIGLTLTIDAASQTVMSLYGLTTLDFTQSAYDALTDFAAVKAMAEQGGYSGYYYGIPTEGSTTTSINLGTPQRVLMSSYLYTDNRSRELYVPALRFSIINPTSGYPTWVVVPLAKDLPTSMPIGIMVPAGTSGDTGTSSSPNSGSGSTALVSRQGKTNKAPVFEQV